MAARFRFSIEGSKQGVFKVDQPGAPKLSGIDFVYAVNIPQDAATGLATGKRRHSPITVTKEWGASSPQIFQALVTHEPLKIVLFEFVTATQKGTEEVYCSIKLTDASISAIKMYLHPSEPREPATSRALEDISFVFGTIDIESVPGRTAGHDAWLEHV